MNKKILSLVMAVALLATMMAVSFASAQGESVYTAYSCCGNGKPLNVRSGPGKQYDVIGKIAYGEELVVNQEVGNGWAEIFWGDTFGYVMTSLISLTHPGPYVAPTTPAAVDNATVDVNFNALYKIAQLVEYPYTIELKATVNSKGVANVRWAPDKKSALLMDVLSGTEATVLATLGKNWYQVYVPEYNIAGFINTAYVVK